MFQKECDIKSGRQAYNRQVGNNNETERSVESIPRRQ